MIISNESKGNPEKVIAVLIALLGLFVPFFMDSVAHSSMVDPARLVGEYLVYLFVASLLSLGISRGLKPQYRAWIFLATCFLFLLFTLRQAYINTFNINKAKETASEMVSMMEDTNRQIIGNQSGVDNQPIKQETEILPATKNTGNSEVEELAYMMEKLKPSVRKLASDGIEINTKINNLGIEKVLEPANLTSASGIRESRQIIKNMVQLVNARNDLLTNYYKDVSAQVNEMGLSESTRQSFEKTFFKNKLMLEYNYGEMTRLGNESAIRLEKILDIAETHLGLIKVETNELIFPDNESLNQYNQLLSEVIKLSEEEERVSKVLAQKSSEHIEMVKDNLRKL